MSDMLSEAWNVLSYWYRGALYLASLPLLVLVSSSTLPEVTRQYQAAGILIGALTAGLLAGGAGATFLSGALSAPERLEKMDGRLAAVEAQTRIIQTNVCVLVARLDNRDAILCYDPDPIMVPHIPPAGGGT